MSEQEAGPTDGADEVPDEPIDCEVCGAPLEFQIGQIAVSEAEWAASGTPVRTELLQRCTNPDCSTRGDSGMAKAVGPDGSAQP